MNGQKNVKVFSQSTEVSKQFCFEVMASSRNSTRFGNVFESLEWKRDVWMERSSRPHKEAYNKQALTMKTLTMHLKFMKLFILRLSKQKHFVTEQMMPKFNGFLKRISRWKNFQVAARNNLISPKSDLNWQQKGLLDAMAVKLLSHCVSNFVWLQLYARFNCV